MTKTANSTDPQNPLITEARTFWLEMSKDSIRRSRDSLNEMAKQIIGATTIIEGLYFNAITFSDLHGKVPISWLLAIYLAPVGLLLISLTASLMIFFPRSYPINIHSSETGRLLYDYTFRHKLRSLRISAIFLVLGIASLLLAVLTYLIS